MAKESVWQRRARKCRAAKDEYYPKVILGRTGDEASDGSPSLESQDAPAETPLAAAETASEFEAASPLPESLDLPAAAETAGEPEAALRLPECLDLPAARPLARALLERRGKPIVLDASSVQQLGAPCVQVLLSAKRTWGADGVALSIVNCAPRMIGDLQLLGIDPTTLTSGEMPQ